MSACGCRLAGKGGPRFVALTMAALFSLASHSVRAVPPAAGPQNGNDHAAHGAPDTSRGAKPPSNAERELGEAVFNTLFVPAGTPGAAEHSGLGPLYDAESCDECHNGAAEARGPVSGGAAPVGLIIELEEPYGRPDGRPAGDPRYGRVLSTRALPGIAPEARVSIRYHPQRGHYPDGTPFTLRVPRYVITDLGYGPLSSRTLIEPRLAPSLYGVGWLAKVPVQEIVNPPRAYITASSPFGTFAIRWRAGRARVGRFGWQGTSVSILDQTTKALERDMGVTSREYPRKDCTPVERACRAHSAGGAEISSRLVSALVAYESSLPRQEARESVELAPPDPMFVRVGCAACHRPRLPVLIVDGHDRARRGWIAPYTDLRLHFLGAALDDRDAAGHPSFTRFRTAPLWNLGHLRGPTPTLLHDGRARSIEEAILWHGGEAKAARRRFMRLSRAARQRLLNWLGRLGAPRQHSKAESAPHENPGPDDQLKSCATPTRIAAAARNRSHQRAPNHMRAGEGRTLATAMWTQYRCGRPRHGAPRSDGSRCGGRG